MSESAFGDLDLDDVGTNPWEVAANTYRAVCTDSDLVDTFDEEGRQVRTWNWTWGIDEPDNEYHGLPVRERYAYFPNKKDFETASAAEKRQIKFLRTRLREAFDIPDAEHGKTTADQLIGKVAYITTKNNPSKRPDDDRVFVNVNKAISQRLYEERQEAAGNSTTESLRI